MANPTISQITVGNSTYDICDPVSRDATQNIKTYTLTLTSNFKCYNDNSGYQPRVYKLGHIGYVSGWVSPKTASVIPDGGPEYQMTEENNQLSLYGNVTHRVLCQGSQLTTWMLDISGLNNDFCLYAGRFKNPGSTSYYIPNSTSYWMPFGAAILLK